MINPLTEMKAKRQQTALNQTQTAKTSKGEQPQAQTQNTHKRAILAVYPQISRQFEMLKSSVGHCKQKFPDCFHHKQQTANECRLLAENLRKGVEMIKAMAVIKPEMRAEAQQAINSSRYLIRQFESVIAEVERVEKANVIQN